MTTSEMIEWLEDEADACERLASMNKQLSESGHGDIQARAVHAIAYQIKASNYREVANALREKCECV